MSPGEEVRSEILAVCGISHKRASLAEREPFHIGRADLAAAVDFFKTIPGVRECVLLATCNRFEAYMVLDGDRGEDGIGVRKGGEDGESRPFSVVRAFFETFKGVDPLSRRDLFFVRHKSSVARHLFRVAAGLDSLVLGEYQIQKQVKEAYSAACAAGGPGKILHRLFHAAFRAGKRVRSSTLVGGGLRSVAGIAVRLLVKRLDPGDGVLLIGVNENTRIVAEGLAAAGFSRLVFANRTASKARKTASRFGGAGIGLAALPEFLPRCRGLVSCTGASGLVVAGEVLGEACRDAGGPAVIVDMAVPRDVELPESLLGSVALFDLEDLKTYLETQEKGRQAAVPEAMSFVEDAVASFNAWLDSAFDPGVANLAKEYERIRQKCLKEERGHFDPRDREALERFSRRLMQTFLKVQARAIMENSDPGEFEGCRGKRGKKGERGSSGAGQAVPPEEPARIGEAHDS